MRDVWVARKPPGFAFVEMEDRRDAQVRQTHTGDFVTDITQDAVRELDGTRMCGNRVKVGPNTFPLIMMVASYFQVEMSNGGKGGRFGRSRSRSPVRRRSPARRSRFVLSIHHYCLPFLECKKSV